MKKSKIIHPAYDNTLPTTITYGENSNLIKSWNFFIKIIDYQWLMKAKSFNH